SQNCFPLVPSEFRAESSPLVVDLLPELGYCLIVNLFQCADRAQHLGIAIRIEIAPELSEGQLSQRRKVRYLRAGTIEDRNIHPAQRHQAGHRRGVTTEDP